MAQSTKAKALNERLAQALVMMNGLAPVGATAGPPTEEDAQAFLRWQSYQQAIDAQDSLPSGRWLCPDKSKDGYVFTRCGVVSPADPKGTERARTFAQIRHDMGWEYAPKGTRSTAYPDDGDRGIYMCVHPVIHAEMREVKRKRIAGEMHRLRGQFIENAREGVMQRTGGHAQVNVRGSGIEGSITLGQRSYT